MNTFGRNFRVSIFGESHGPQIGVTLDGVIPGLPLCEEDFAADIDRRRPGAAGTTPRKEADVPHIVSGVFEGHTTGAPLTVIFDNGNTRSEDYSQFVDVPRPGHADFSAGERFAMWNDPRGGGHFSGRITLAVVAAGVVAKKMVAFLCGDMQQESENDTEAQQQLPVRVSAALSQIAGLDDPNQWDEAIAKAREEGDSVGGIVSCSAVVPSGIGNPFWDSVESMIAHAVFAIPGVRGIEFGDGFKASAMRGSEHNDPFGEDGLPAKNGSGGVNGGITNGAPIAFKVAFKPTSTIAREQQTLDFSTGEMTSLAGKGRHDVCFALRTPVIVEAVTAIVLADLMY